MWTIMTANISKEVEFVRHGIEEAAGEDTTETIIAITERLSEEGLFEELIYEHIAKDIHTPP